MLSYNPGGHEELDSSSHRRRSAHGQRQRDEGFLFWLAWVAPEHDIDHVDGRRAGNFRRFTISASCSTIRGLVQDEAVSSLLGLTEFLSDPGLCPSS
jgi:hypothetical protein